MLSIKNSVSIELLADDMIEKITEVWKNPFEAPVVIFPDSKIAQWFKFRWVEKYGSFANLNTKRLENYIFEYLVNEGEDYKILTVDLLRNIIIAYLNNKIESNKDEKIFEEIKNYLFDKKECDGESLSIDLSNRESLACNYDFKKLELNQARLFDLADTLACLFLEYESTRPFDFQSKSNDNAGIIDSWINDKPFFFADKKGNEKANIKEEWQKKIYSDIFSENGLLKNINEKIKDEKEISGTFITLPQLFRKKYLNQSNDSNNFTSVFIFGFDSLGQFYRNAVKYLALNNTIYLYLTNPFSDCSNEEIKNDLLVNWGSLGKENLELWLEGVETEQNSFIKTNLFNLESNSDLLLLQRAIIENKETLSLINSNNSNIINSSLTIQSAPTKLREVEILHSNICNLLLKKKVQIKDILVVSPELDSYRSAINQVFNQSAQITEEEKNSKKNVLHIPFTFVDSNDNESLTYLALRRLFILKEKGYLTRPDFFDLVRNPVVQTTRGIIPDEISNWEGWVSSMEVYRDREIIIDKENIIIEKNWIKSVKSLLLAKLSNNDIVINQQYLTISPFSDINSSDNESLCRFIDCIDDIEIWLGKGIDGSFDIDEAFDLIEKWLLMNIVPKGLGNENYIFQKVIKAKEDLKWQFLAGSESIPWKIFSRTLLNASNNAKYNTGNLFVNGISFMKFSPNRIIPTKYLFMLGIDEKTFPRKDYKDSLDLRKEKTIAGDELNSVKDKFAFLNQLLNVKEAFYISYVNKDLQRDEDFYPSSVIDDMARFFTNSGGKIHREEYGNIENRDWKELFTQSALRNKESLEIMLKKKDNEEKEIPSEQSLSAKISNNHSNSDTSSKEKNTNKVYPERVSVYQLRSFLEEPFKARVNRILYSEDEEDTEKIEFEPIELNKLEISQIRKELVIYCLINNINTVEKLEEILNKKIEKNTNHLEYILDNLAIKLPKDNFGNKIKLNLFDDIIFYVNNIISKFNGYEFCSEDLSHEFELLLENQNFLWTLSGNAKIIAKKDDEIHIIDLASSKIKSYSYMNSYILALLYKVNCSDSYRVFIDLIGEEDYKSIIINLSCEQAYIILNNIYKKIFVENYHKVLPIELFKEELDYQSYISKFEDEYGNPWAFFSAKNLFDIKEISGFTKDRFEDKWEEEKNKQLELFPEELKKELLPNKGKKK